MIQRNPYRFALLALCLASVACGDKASEGTAGTGPAAGSGGSISGGTGGAAAGSGGSTSGGTGGDGASGMNAGTDAPPVGGVGGVGGAGGGSDEMPMLEPNTPWADVPDQCKGFEVVGLTNSPGGNVLPNICAPFHGTFNNPYAIRCIDADPAYDTGFLGDEWCILPPPEDLGTQIHVGPDSYENIDPGFLLAVGDEKNDYYYVNAPNAEEHFYYRTNWRMRSGSHHMIINLIEEREDGWATIDLGGGIGGNTRSFGGAQRPDQDRPQGTLEVPPENNGLGARLRAQDQFSFNLHHFNMTESETLREAWVNVWYKPEQEVTQEMQGIAIFGNPADLNIPPGEHRELIYSCDVSGSTRVITLNGHRHKSTDRFGVWLTRAGESDTIPIYESFQYTDMPTYQYDSVSMNPVPDLALKHDGGFSGMLELSPGDKLTFVCDVTNHNDVALRFANEVETGEMCILFGSRTGDPLCGAGTREN